MRTLPLPLLVAALVLPLSCASRPAPAPAARVAKPQRVILVMVDQLRPDLIDAAPMKNLQALRERGASFEDAYVGHLGAKTVVSHAVVTRGLLPKRIGWTDDVMRDATGALGKPGALWDTGRLTLDQYNRLLPEDVPTFARAFGERGRRVSIAQKDYSARTMAGHDADVVLTLSGKKTAAEAGSALEGWLAPEGVNVPAYIAEPKGNRFWLDGRPAFGTESSAYALGGTKFWRGDDPSHPGGDAWVVDAAIAILEREEWSTMLLSLGGVDRVGHMMGMERDLRAPNPSQVTFRQALLDADAAIGRLVEALRAKGQLDSTLIVVSADHGGAAPEDLRSRRRTGKLGYDWNWGRYENLVRLDPQPDVAALVAGGGVQGTSTDTAIRVWAIPGDPAAASLPERVQAMPGVISVWKLVVDEKGARYEETFRDLSSLPADERAFHEARMAELVQSQAAPQAADVVALLDHRTGYAAPGDHGGAQKSVQSIPLIFLGPNVKPGRRTGERARLVDVAPTIWALAGREPPKGLDGVPLCAAVVSSPACP